MNEPQAPRRASGSVRAPGARSAAADVGAGVALAIAFALLYRATFQDALYGDGPLLLERWTHVGRPTWMHPLYFRAAEIVRALAAEGVTDATVLRRLSWISGAVAVASSYGCARACCARPLALALALLVGLSPALWFFATTIELHALAAAAVATAGWLTWILPWRRPALALALALPPLALAFAAHRTHGLLVPGFVLWIAAARAGRAEPFGARALLAVAAVVAAPALLVATFADAAGRFLASPGTTSAEHVAQLFGPLGAILPIAALGVVRVVRERLARPIDRALVAFVAPTWVFFTWFGIHERGGYLASTACFAALLGLRASRATSAPAGRRMATVALALALAIAIALQALLGARAATPGIDPELRASGRARAAAAVAALGEGGVLFSFDATRQTLAAHVSQVREINLAESATGLAASGAAPDAIAHRLADLIEAYPGRAERTLGIDLGFRETRMPRDHRTLVETIVAGLEARFETRLAPGSPDVLVLLEPRR